MSHTVKIKTLFKDLEVLKRTLLEDFGWTVVEGTTRRIRTYSSQDSAKQYDFVAVNPKNGYDLGLTIDHTTGEVHVYGDMWTGYGEGGNVTIEAQLGRDLSKLKQQYSLHVLEDQLIYKGYQVDYEKMNNGTIEVTATKLEQSY